MIRVKVKKQGVVTNQAEFASQELAQAWYDVETANFSFGKKEVEVIDELTGATSIVIEPADVEVQFEDITAQVEAEAAQLLALKQAQLAAASRLESFDSEIDSASDLESLKAKIKTFVMDVAVLLK